MSQQQVDRYIDPEPLSWAGVWERHQTAITRLSAVILVLGFWEWAARSGKVNPLFLSSPSRVFVKLYQIFADGSIWPHIGASAEIAGLGFGLSILFGVPIGIAMGRSRFIRDSIEPFVMASYASPTVAFLPLIILWLGLGVWSKTVLVLLGAIFVIIINTEVGVSSIDRRLTETARSFCANEREVLFKIILPAALPFILAGFRLAIGRVLIMVVVAEFYASTAGVGYLIFQAGANYDTALMFAGVIILAGTGVILNAGMRAIEARIAPWLSKQAD
jgi:ABC-type nitrate/sulfonate/bicarbonate transport system permease component